MDIEFLKNNINYMDGLTNKIEITIRINILHGNLSLADLIGQIKDSFNNEGIKFRSDPDIPELFWIPRSQKKKVIRNSFYRKNQLIFQDKASTAIIQALNPKKKDKILDMCAAPGIKTSLIAQFMNNQGYIVAGDFNTERTRIMRSLLKKFNILNVYIINTDSILFPIRFQNYFDCVLLDAPCTGSGTFLTNPELKWRQNERFLHQNLVLQKKLIENALELLKTNGIFVYSTCSLYPEEGESQILKILHRLEPLDLPEWFSPSYTVNNNIIPGTGRLFPTIHHTQGFFIGKFKKKY
ncbi:MAG: RsmB/NOP family class I SAM-dependent RNA methyltransferase [Promethearchaeota archaeon]